MKLRLVCRRFLLVRRSRQRSAQCRHQPAGTLCNELRRALIKRFFLIATDEVLVAVPAGEGKGAILAFSTPRGVQLGSAAVDAGDGLVGPQAVKPYPSGQRLPPISPAY